MLVPPALSASLSLSLFAGLMACETQPVFGHAGDATAPTINCEEDTALDMVTIAAGSFTMGSPKDETGRNASDDVAHEVTLDHAYCIGTTEVTYDLYTSVGATVEGGWPPLCEGDCPIHSVSWFDAALFTVLLSEQEGLEPCYECSDDADGYTFCEALYDQVPSVCGGYRLPTEAEWENAARAGSTHTFWDGGDLPEGPDYTYSWVCDPDLTLTSGNRLSDFAVFCGVDDTTPHPVGTLLPNPWGLYDVIGNVFEWIHEPYDDPPGTNQWGVVGLTKGGAFDYSASDQRTAFRYGSTQTDHMQAGGLRVVRTASAL